MTLTEPDFLAQVRNLAGAGVAIILAPSDGPFGRMVTFADPDAYTVTIQDKQ